jgi:hypothetical protein
MHNLNKLLTKSFDHDLILLYRTTLSLTIIHSVSSKVVNFLFANCVMHIIIGTIPNTDYRSIVGR